MEFGTVRMNYNPIDNTWYVLFADLEGDRKNKDHGPHPTGFYHYLKDIGPIKAFTILKDYLIKDA